MAKKPSWDDDGRTIADMSGVERPSLFGHLPRKKPKGDAPNNDQGQPTMTKEQSRAYIGGALLAGLLIAGVFIIAGAIAIALMIAVWTH